ncbi:hypothetical protein ACWOFR_13740 [Carnobacterium gallinarum]|uniref:hypothetical protein n=1 Tax=Carnobacterium gallinarum TaxID=2749 RepID=UPI00055990AF|nr:hypothetical protein [Carnobacterium gallinarum]
MKTIQLPYGWTLKAPLSLTVLTNEAGEVGILYPEKNFGDVQTLLLTLSDDYVAMNSIPHSIGNVAISLDKVITVTLTQFVEDFEKNNEFNQEQTTSE